MDQLCNGKLKLNKDGNIEITAMQFHLFWKDSPSQHLIKGPVIVSPLKFAGSVCLALNYNKGIAHMIAEKLLPHLQAMAAPEEYQISLISFWDHTITTYLNKVVTFRRSGETYSGILKGVANRSKPSAAPFPPDFYQMRISGQEDWEVRFGLYELARCSAVISLEEAADEKAEDEGFEKV
jgi:hypothetical protein